MPDNKATIDLMANPKGVKVGTDAGTKHIHDFSEKSIKELEKLGLSSEELEERISSLKERLAELVATNSSITESQAELGLTFAKNAVEIAACLGLFGPLIQVLANAKSAAEVANSVLENTSKTLQELNPNLDRMTKQLVDAAGGFDNFQKKVNEAGLELKDFGIKTENNAERVKKATSEMLGQISNGEYKKAWDSIASDALSTYDYLAHGTNKLANDMTDDFENMAKAGGDAFKYLRDQAARWLTTSGAIIQPGGKGGADESDTKANEGGQATRKKSEDDDAAQRAKALLQKESLAFEFEISKVKQDNRRKELEDIELLGVTLMKEVNERIKREEVIREELKASNTLNSEAGKDSYERTAKLEGVSKSISLEYRRQAEEARNIVKEVEDIADHFKKQKEAIELNNAGVEELKEKLIASNAEMAAAARNQAKEDEARIERQQRIVALKHKSEETPDNRDKEAIEAAIVAVGVEQEKVDKAAKDRITTNSDLRQSINQKQLDAIEIEKRAIDARYSLEETRIGELDRATMVRLKAEGTSDADLHTLKLDMMQEEAKRALAHADENKDRDQAKAERIRINGQLEKDVLQENANFALAEDMKVFKEKDRQFSITTDRIHSTNEATLRVLKAQGATEDMLHDQRLKMLDAEFERRLEHETDNEKRLDIAAQHKIDKAKEIAAFQLNEDLKRYKLAEISRGIGEAKEDAEFKKKFAQMELNGAKAKKLHEARLKHIDEEEKRELGKTNGLIEQAAIRASAKKAHIQEVTDFEISEMKRIKDLENDVKNGKISFAVGLKKSGIKPLSRQEINDNLKQRAKDHKKGVVKAAKAKAEAEENKKKKDFAKAKGNKGFIAEQIKNQGGKSGPTEAQKKGMARAALIAKVRQNEEFNRAVRDHNKKFNDDPRRQVDKEGKPLSEAEVFKRIANAAEKTNENEGEIKKLLADVGALK